MLLIGIRGKEHTSFLFLFANPIRVLGKTTSGVLSSVGGVSAAVSLTLKVVEGENR